MNYKLILFRFKFTFLVLIFISANSWKLQSQIISGKVISSVTKEPIPFANVTLPRANESARRIGVSANEQGQFMISLSQTPPFQLEFSAVGYSTKTVTFNEYLNNATIELNEDLTVLESVTVKSEKISKEELKSNKEISRLDLVAIRSDASFNFFDAIVNLKGVDMTTESVVINSVNARGFNITGNPRFKQFTDGIDSETPGLNFSLGNIIGPNVLDIESIELIPGPSTALFGPSAFSGVLSMKTKNPFDYPGLSISTKAASAAIDTENRKAIHLGNFIGDISARYSAAYKDKVGFKVGASFLRGSDFRARNYLNIGPGFGEDTYSHRNQGLDGVNVYGDDRSAVMVLPISPVDPTSPDTAFLVTREGYREEDLVNHKASNLKLNAEIQVNLSPELRLNLASFYAKTSSMITGIDRLALRNFQIAQHKIELTGDNFLVRGYTTQQNSGNTFNVGLLGDRMVRASKPDAVWYDQYRRVFLNLTRNVPVTERHQTARRFADSIFPGNYESRYEPGTARYDSLKTAIINSSENGLGAALPDKSKLYNLDTQYDFKKSQDFFDELIVGSNLRIYDPESSGTVFIDSIGNDVTNYQYGLFVQAKKSINTKIDLTASLRYDKNENFDAKLSQRLSAVYEYSDIHFFRFSFQRGFRMPNLREQFLNQDIGDKRIIGGLRKVTDYYDLHNNTFLVRALEEYNNKVIEGVVDMDAEYEANKILQLPILEKGIIRDGQFTGLEPERITSFEFGYRGLVDESRLFEFTIYRNYYKNFIGNLRLVKPRTSPSIDLAKAAEQANNFGASELIYVTENSETPIITQGAEFLYDYSANSGTYLIVNMTLVRMLTDSKDPLTPGFNTPPFKFNIKLGHRKITKNFGAELAFRGRNDFVWESPFADGTVDEFGTFDMQLTFRLPRLNSMIRLGGNNMYNIDQYNTFGGAEINAFYYISLTYDPLQIVNPFN